MRIRLFFTLGLVLLLSTFASSNECARYGRKTRVCSRCEVAGEQAVDPWAAKFPGRQADPVHHDQLRQHPRRALIEVRRQHLAHPGHQAGDHINTEGAMHDRLA